MFIQLVPNLNSVLNRLLRSASTLFLLALAAISVAANAQPVFAPHTPIAASAPLGTVVTATLSLDNFGQPANTVLLFEALESGPATPAQARGELRVPLPADPGPLTASLVRQLAAAPDGQAAMLIFLADQADLSAAAALPDWNARGTAVVDTLRAHAAKAQAGLLADLRAAGFLPTSYWIVNAIGVTGDAGLAQWAAAQPAVALVAANELHALEAISEAAALTADEGPAWGVSRINAPGAWDDWGVRGGGITVATIDTGVAYTHTALLSNYRGWSAGGVDHNYNWFDAAGEPARPEPTDTAGHGTHVMGTVVGHGAPGYTALGVAPEARWIAARGCAGIFCSDEDLLASAQWLLAPTDLAGNAPRPDLRPHLINNSWGKAGEDDWYVGYVQAWNASGIFSVFANGNAGSLVGCGSSSSPGQYAHAFAVGATDAEDFIADFSSRGPTTDDRIKPDLSAPGVGIPSAWPDGGVHNLNGTSMAAPHVSGAVALLWSANPGLIGDLAATRAALTGSAVPLTSTQCGPSHTAVPNNVYGWGRLDARMAVQAARVDVPWLSVPVSATLPANDASHATLTLDARQVSAPGTYLARLLVFHNNSLASHPITFTVTPAANTAQVTGRLTDRWSGGGVYGRVQAGAGPTAQTDPAGQFTMTLPFGTYAVTAAATGYLSVTTSTQITASTVSGFVLTPDLPHLALSAATPFSATLDFGQRYTGTVTLTNLGTQPLSVTTFIASQEWAIDAAGASGAALYDVSNATALTLEDDSIYSETLDLGFSLPIYGQLVSQLYLSSNGWLSVARPGSAQPLANCLSEASLPAGTLAAFWTDLDPSVGGAVRVAAIDLETFVVSFEAVPHWQEEPDPAAPTYTFQIVLHASGEVEYLFGVMGELPARWAMGMAESRTRAQSLACHKSPAELAHRGWTAHNQPPVPFWLTTSAPAVSVPPGASADLAVIVKGFGYVPWLTRPFIGDLRLLTNDPSQPIVDLAAQAIVGPAPVTAWLPIMHR